MGNMKSCLFTGPAVCCRHFDKAYLGLIIDWLEILDPEMTSLCSDMQDKLLFGRMSGASQLAGPAYLRSQLTHQARWSTITNTVNRLLTAEDSSIWDASSLLDLLKVCVSHPRLHQGQENKKSNKVSQSITLYLHAVIVLNILPLYC